MHQDRKMTRSSSVVEVDIKAPSLHSSTEAHRSKHQKLGPHPKKKMLRSHSESAIDLNLLRAVMKQNSTTSVDTEKNAGIICSNEDFQQIITESKRHRFGRKRNNTMVIQLESTPEVTPETEIQLDNRLSEKKESGSKHQIIVTPERKDSKERVIKLPMRQCVGSDPNSPSHLAEAKRDNVRLSPLTLHKNNINNSSNRSIHISPKALNSRLTRRDANPDELEPMLPRDKNGNHLIEKSLLDELVIEEQAELDVEIVPAKNDNESTGETGESTFDAQLLGEAIERHLAMQRQSSPGRKSPARCGEGRKRSGSLKSMLGQNNSQITTRLGSLISRFPFKRDGSVSPTNSENGVTV